MLIRRRLKISVTKIRRTRTPDKSSVLHVICPVCRMAPEVWTATESDEVMETGRGESGDGPRDTASCMHRGGKLDSHSQEQAASDWER